MEKVIQAVGALLMIGILVLAILVYANVAGISDVLNYLKAGIDRLTGFLVPKNYSVTITALGNATKSGNVVTLQATATGSYQVAQVDIYSDKPLKVALQASVASGSATFTASLSSTNAIVYKEVEQTGANTYLVILRIYPTDKQGSVTLTISASVTTAPATINVAVSEATYI